MRPPGNEKDCWRGPASPRRAYSCSSDTLHVADAVQQTPKSTPHIGEAGGYEAGDQVRRSLEAALQGLAGFGWPKADRAAIPLESRVSPGTARWPCDITSCRKVRIASTILGPLLG